MVYFILYYITLNTVLDWRLNWRSRKTKWEDLMGKWQGRTQLEGKKASTAFIRRSTDFAMLYKVDGHEKFHNMEGSFVTRQGP